MEAQLLRAVEEEEQCEDNPQEKNWVQSLLSQDSLTNTVELKGNMWMKNEYGQICEELKTTNVNDENQVR